MPGLLKDKVALVTGGSSGIGRATAKMFFREGAKVVVADVDRDGGAGTVSWIREKGGDGVFVECDVSNPEDIEAMIEKVINVYNRLDCAFNNAGVGGGKSTVDCTEEEWNHVININLKGVWLCMKYEIPEILKVGGGSIVNTSSAAGLTGSPNRPAYTASKHGVIGLTKVAALEYAESGIRVNAICPGGVRTRMLDPLLSNKEYADSLLSRHPMRRIAQPEEIAEAVVWLCSDLASFVTGVALPVDGGYVVP